MMEWYKCGEIPPELVKVETKQVETKKMRIYISGPITGVEGYVKKFTEARGKLNRLYPDAELIDPSYLGVMYPGYTWEEYMGICMILIKNCTHIYMLKGWQKSRGAKEELLLALNQGMEVIGDGEAGD